MKLTSFQSKILIALISLFLLSAVIYFYSSQETTLPKMTVQEKKARFKELIIPAVNEVYAELMEQYQDVSASLKSGDNIEEIEELKVEYKAKSDAELLMALKPHPKSIAIAQAAMESSWATSRFFREAYNIFGVWSFDEDEPRIAALQKRGDKTIWVKEYSSVKASVRDYYRTIARSTAFKEFRKLKMKTDDPFALVKKLDRYSEKGAEYGHELTSIIKFNKFHKLKEVNTED
ncbi:glucosaminidase domain-containing protein [Colwellia sp. BRX10-3]|uniref:glucosaminidase domain-containing protein n=1 Tax=Colwellia sp. BRX10-3 TaxID=2759844 RepID=UPI0015F47213|nr:glucosaminidase domain-containing protein [Colwellia sp. BRX10-3]MBA6389786.1 glucosaminidase domain-containing protein [Colwellia sp. BRX10-3]